MRILVTNDDGIGAPGLHALVRAMCTLDGDHEIDCKMDGMAIALKACFVKKVGD